jgi:DNA polymerase III delta subunit
MARRTEPTPTESLAALASALEKDGLARGYVFRGDERYFRERAIDLVRAAAERRGDELSFHDGERANPDFKLPLLIDDLSGGGLFARRLVVIRHPGDHLKKTEGEDSPLTRAILAFVASEAGCVLLSDAALRADHPVAKAIAAAGGSVLSFRKLWDTPPPWRPHDTPELVGWVQQRARELGLRLDQRQALYVCAATGNDLFELDEELRLLQKSGARDLRAVVRWTAGGSPWAVADVLAGGDLPRSLSGVEALFRAGFQEKDGRRLVDPGALANMVIAALQRSGRAALALASALERGASEAEAASAAELGGGPTAVHAALARARRRSPLEWRALLADAALLERSAKSHAGADASDFAAFALRWALAPARGR